MKYPFHVLTHNAEEQFSHIVWDISEEAIRQRKYWVELSQLGYEILIEKMVESHPLVLHTRHVRV